MTRFLRLLIASAAFAANAQSNIATRLLIEAPVKITVEDKSTSSVRPVTTFNLAINQGTHEFRFAVLQHGNAADALAAQKARTGWKDGYLFIRDDCLNSSETKRVLRCVVDQVFTFVDSRDGKRLVHLGEVAAGEDCIDELRIGCALYQGVFTDIYDTLEKNVFVGRADAPAPLLEMRVVSGEWVVDLVDTWGRNQERYGAGERCLAAKPSERAVHCIEGITPRRAYLFNSTLATYTQRVEDLDRIRGFARSALCEKDKRGNDERGNDKRGDDVGRDAKSGDEKRREEKRRDGEREEKTDADCSEILRLSALMLAGIRPGEKPRPRGNVQSIPLPPNK